VPQTLDEAFESLEFRFLINLPDEELEKPERLFFQIEQAHWFYEDFLADEHKHLRHFHDFKQFAKEMFKRCEMLQSMMGRFDEMHDAFAKYRTRIPVFGAILLNADMTRVLLVKSYRGNSWGFPKGKVNQDEADYDCAAREVYEEIGYDCSSLINPNHFVESMSKQGKQIKLFIVRGVPEDFSYAPRVRKEISEVKFFNVSELPTNKENKSRKFWALQVFTPRLLRWIQRQPKTKGTGGKSGSRPKSRPHDNDNAFKSTPEKPSRPETRPLVRDTSFRFDANAIMRAMAVHL